MASKSIETGVDKLVDLINRKKKLTIQEAAKELEVSTTVIQEWADFLDDEGLITVEQKFNKTILSEKKLTKGEVEKKATEYVSKKDAFVRKVETALSSMQKESEGLSLIKEEFEKLKDAIGGDIDLVREELQELKHYEELKKNMDKEILQQRLDYQEMVEGFRKKINEEKKKYELHLESISSEKNKIEEAKTETSFLEKKQETLNRRLDALKEIVKGIEQDIARQNKLMKEATSSMDSKIKDSERILKEMKYKLELDVEPIMKKVKDNEEKMLSVQNAMLQKIIAKHKDVNKYKFESTEAAAKLKDFFDRRTSIKDMISSLEKEKLDIEKELKELISKAQAFSLSTKNTDIKNYVKDLNESLAKIESNKNKMRSGIEKLTDLLQGIK